MEHRVLALELSASKDLERMSKASRAVQQRLKKASHLKAPCALVLLQPQLFVYGMAYPRVTQAAAG